MERKRASDFDQELLNLYDDYAHGRIVSARLSTRRG